MDKLRAHADRGTVESVFDDFKGRRAGLLKALTTEVEKFHQECDPEKENLCLYGLPDETWEVSMPVEEIPPELPEPVLGINFARDGMEEKHWLSLVAVHGDSWLLSVAFYLGARFGFGKSQRKKLFQMINGVPTLYEVVQLKYNGNKTKPNGKTVAEFAEKLKGPSATQSNGNKRTTSEEAEPHPKTVKMSPPAKEYDENDEEEEAEGEDDEQENTLCGVCGENYEADEFWIGCDVCEKWFHGACVKVTPAKAEHIKHYKCPTCSSKRARIPM